MSLERPSANIERLPKDKRTDEIPRAPTKIKQTPPNADPKEANAFFSPKDKIQTHTQ